MIVYVLSKIDRYERVEILGVFLSITSAVRYAQSQEPDRPFPWVFREDGAAVASARFSGPLYSYDVDLYEVRS